MKGDTMNVLKSFFLRQNKILIITLGYFFFFSDFAFAESEGAHSEPDYIALLFVFMLCNFYWIGSSYKSIKTSTYSFDVFN